MSNKRQNKFLTEFFGECYHEWKPVPTYPSWKKCESCGAVLTAHNDNRNFETPDDYFWLVDKLWEEALWGEFWEWFYDRHFQGLTVPDWMDEALNRVRFPNKVYEFLQEKGKRDEQRKTR